MKLLSLIRGDRCNPALLTGDDVLDLVGTASQIELAKAIPSTMREVLAGGHETMSLLNEVAELAKQPEVAKALRETGAIAPFGDTKLGPVVPDPQLILSGSMNSWGHLREMGDEKAEFPCAFIKFPSSLSSSGANIVLPPGHSDMVDWEGEFCVVIGKECHQVSRDEADEYIFGYTLMNDVSAREFAMEFIRSKGLPPVAIAQAWERNVFGKNFPTFCPVGPIIVSKDEMPTPFSYRMETIVNGEVMQESTEEDLVFDIWDMISYFSEFLVFQPGDIISMGSPPGVGMARDPQVFLKPGDVVEVQCSPIGTLRNHVV